MARIKRRELLQRSFTGAGLMVVGGSLFRCSNDETTTSDGIGGMGGMGGSGEGGIGDGGGGNGGAGGEGGTIQRVSNIGNLGPLQDADANGVRLPAGFTSRIVARSGEAPAGSSYAWHGAPDGGAVYSKRDGGWIYVSNAELGGSSGGVGALVF